LVQVFLIAYDVLSLIWSRSSIDPRGVLVGAWIGEERGGEGRGGGGD
jgi:hypothetical protein